MPSDDLLNIFRVEVEEYLEQLNTMLLQAEMMASTDPSFKPIMIEMNRIAHSMKGAARAVGFSKIETLGHYMEDIFGAVMNGRVQLLPHVCDTLYDSLDVIQAVMSGEEVEDETFAGVTQALEQIVTLTATPTVPHQVEVMPAIRVAPHGDSDNADESDPSEDAVKEVTPPTNGGRYAPPPVSIATAPPPTPSVRRPHSDDRAVPTNLDSQTISMRPVEESVRVTVSKLDKLMAEATELIVARMRGEERLTEVQTLRRSLTRWQREWRSVRSAYIRLVRRLQDREIEGGELPILFKFLETNQRYLQEITRRLTQLGQSMAQDTLHLTMLSDQLQEEIDSMRLIPFETLVSGYQRIVRDLSRDMGKQIQFEVIGAFVEIDKTVLEALKDPLMHLLRNSIDHGIETPQERERAGKSPVGRITMRVEQRGSEIVLAVSDDGRGIDADKVRRAIVKNKLLTQAEADALSDDEARFYIFQAGFSTSDTVTTISGRGFGMDIVRDRVEGLRGRISLESRTGSGTTVTLNMPVSLTRIRCILARLGEEHYAIPSVVVERMEKLRRSDVFTAEGRDMIVINGQPVPLLSLGAVLRVPTLAGVDNDVSVLLLRSANRLIAFEVDSLISEQELVLKPLGHELSRARFVAGAALLGDGSVVIVLDANDLVRAASGGVMPRRRQTVTSPAATKQRRVRVLVVDDSITTRTLEKNILETAGFDVQVAIDGAEAFSMLAEQEFDLVISDVEMPNMNGLELTAQIKSTPQYRDIPVVLLTSLAKPEQREAGLRAGADAYLVKSQFDQGELLVTIQSVLLTH